jgi:hypothetical protein
MTFGHSLGDLILIVGVVDGEGGAWIGDLVEQSVSHRGLVDPLASFTAADDDLAAGGIGTDTQFPPGSAAGRAVLFDQPFAGSARLQACAVRRMQPGPGPCDNVARV